MVVKTSRTIDLATFLGGGDTTGNSIADQIARYQESNLATQAKDYQDKVWTVEDNTATQDIDKKHLINPQDKELDVQAANVAEKLVKLGQYVQGLTKRMEDAKIGHDTFDRENLHKLREEFPPKEPEVLPVVLPKELVQQYGGNAQELKFGAQTITSDEQYEKLKAEVEIAKQYLGNDIKLHRINYNKGGKLPVAVVMGVDAEEFNAVIAAERHREKAVQEQEKAKGQLTDLMQKMTSPDAAQSVDTKEVKEKTDHVAAEKNYVPPAPDENKIQPASSPMSEQKVAEKKMVWAAGA